MNQNNPPKGIFGKHPVIANLLIIIILAVLGVLLAYVSLALFTKHGENDVVPRVENMSYTQAVNILHDQGFNVDIRDSLYKEDVKPGYVIEQFPKANSVVKPGRKIFLYINAVHPKEVVIDENRNTAEYALRGVSFRQGLARLEELGFKNIKVVKVLGENDRIVKITANGQTVRNMQKVPVNARIIIEVSDGRLTALRDSLYEQERIDMMQEQGQPVYEDPYTVDPGYNPSLPAEEPSAPSREQSSEEEEGSIEYF